MDTLINYIIKNKELFVILISSLTLLFTIVSFFIQNKNNKLKENISNTNLLLQKFYSPILNNHALNKEKLFSDDICNFIYTNSFLLDDLISILAFEILKLESNFSNTLNDRFFYSKYKKTREYFISIVNLYSQDLSRIYKLDSFSISNKYLFPSKVRFIFNLLDTLIFASLFMITILIILGLSNNITELISFPFVLSSIWLLYRFQILSLLKKFKYVAHKPQISNFNIFFHNQYSEFDALYINLLTKKTYLVFKGLPIPKSSNLSLKEAFSIYKIKQKF